MLCRTCLRCNRVGRISSLRHVGEEFRRRSGTAQERRTQQQQHVSMMEYFGLLYSFPAGRIYLKLLGFLRLSFRIQHRWKIKIKKVYTHGRELHAAPGIIDHPGAWWVFHIYKTSSFLSLSLLLLFQHSSPSSTPPVFSLHFAQVYRRNSSCCWAWAAMHHDMGIGT